MSLIAVGVAAQELYSVLHVTLPVLSLCDLVSDYLRLLETETYARMLPMQFDCGGDTFKVMCLGRNNKEECVMTIGEKGNPSIGAVLPLKTLIDFANQCHTPNDTHSFLDNSVHF